MVSRRLSALVPKHSSSQGGWVIAVALVLAPLLMLLVSALEDRLGPSAAGWAAALPVTFAVSTAAVTVHSGASMGGQVALIAASFVPAQVAFAIAFAGVLWRRGLVLGLIAGMTTYFVAARIVTVVPPTAAVVAGVVAVATGPRLMPQLPIRPGTRRSWLITTLNCAAAALVVGAVILATQLSGASLAGMIAAYPMMCSILTIIVVNRSGRDAGVHVLTGLVRSLPAYLTFGVVAAAVQQVSNEVAIPIALLTCLAVVFATWRRVPTATQPVPAH
jgi:uncharacterized membrane protein SirB2